MPARGSRNNAGPRNARLESLLRAMIERPEEFEALAEEIDSAFGAERAVLVLDMSGFSRTTQRRGIVALLLMVHQMKRLALPAIETHGGRLVKAEADNLYCLFARVSDALAAASRVMEQLDGANRALPGDTRLYASAGIGFGRILDIDGEDLFGDEVNLASKLGEDVADRGEILLTAAAAARAEGVETSEEAVSVSGLELIYFRVI